MTAHRITLNNTFAARFTAFIFFFVLSFLLLRNVN